MKIIRRGQPPEQKTYFATCNHCKTEIEFERSEARYVSDQRDGDFLEVKCPVCSKPITKAV